MKAFQLHKRRKLLIATVYISYQFAPVGQVMKWSVIGQSVTLPDLLAGSLT